MSYVTCNTCGLGVKLDQLSGHKMKECSGLNAGQKAEYKAAWQNRGQQSAPVAPAYLPAKAAAPVRAA